ncbi:YafY family protein [Cellulosimicrobium sp. CUA-896]|uniref:helix-turn-helix transcriptional regulator n=1 Tax=Cellulosimicrobium sp. CUA-896 TaxID=1517881 RepID=UPI0009604FDF|nr:WYL domain-containing protein [Cellulosimicrobium sp. CUA-896]OLT54579.1 DNA-binding protein [Cellulosimicrobium sp. CUA-896]
MNRTERLYAIAEQLRRAGRTGTTGRRLATALEVSERTIKRDVSALQQAGLTIWAQAGPGGGYVLDPSATLPPVNFTPGQAVAVAVALATLPPGSPFAVDALAARGKVWDALATGDRDRAEALAARVWVRQPPGPPDPDDGAATEVRTADGTTDRSGAADRVVGPVVGPARSHLRVLRAVEQSLGSSRVLAIRYRDRHGEESERRVEPVILAHTDGRWYLVAWCRLREGVRWFRLARVVRADVTREAYVPRPVEDVGEPPAGAVAVR